MRFIRFPQEFKARLLSSLFGDNVAIFPKNFEVTPSKKPRIHGVFCLTIIYQLLRVAFCRLSSLGELTLRIIHYSFYTFFEVCKGILGC